jgi:anhydro-N-acetylmuramic acid kinase
MAEPRREQELVLCGLMSGTSLDGISAAVVRFHAGGDGRVEHELLASHSVPYGPERRARIAAALTAATPDEYCRLNFDLGEWLAQAAVATIAESGVPRADVAAIASHGQTIWHVPGHSTWQMGEAAVIAERTGISVVSDFRVRDVAAGGQGAPLVPMADALLYARADGWRALQNLGGIGNVTVVPPSGALDGTRAFDTGPGVVVIDTVTRLLRPELPYDVDGALATQGSPVMEVVSTLLAAPYFAAPPPKSTGRELFDPVYAQHLVEACRLAREGATDADCIATAVALTAGSIADSWKRFLPEPVGEVLVSGGGAENPALMDAITGALADRAEVRRFSDVFYDGEAKESVAFALLGWLFLTGRPGNVPRATGARGPRLLGVHTRAG